ncbi:glucan biosynthesis protein [Methylocaldum sp. RMAD-M]|uniref:glucan biosynthesis protein n=1 Tax=Methylocaldum sp. RMAD-M TaxID=2806557 RepID=UPI000A326952|nr:glucan biosynthesis protein [Methylocaldum sp. RMAD-M]MBP1152466.1 glucans biosynthesis protein [Methylocaldum sp. RMAD-M]
MMTRRDLLARLLTLAAWGVLSPAALYTPLAEAKGKAGPKPFSKAWLIEEAKRLSRKPFDPPKEKLPAWIANLDWDDYQSIRFKTKHSIWAKQDLPFQARLFHLGLFFKHPVEIYEVVHGVAEPIEYSTDLFEFGSKLERPRKVGDIGFAGFRVNAEPDFERDMFAFLGASYFRAVGSTKQYGLSARGLAVDTGLPRPEEFPEFRRFWLERPSPKAEFVTIHALLDSPSVTGAYTFEVNPGDTTVMEIEAHLFPRKSIERIGIAPLTSMYQHGENDRRVSDDFRPEIHDSDGLALWAGTDEWIWRPLVNSPVVRVNSFVDNNPKGFGLLQRDRNFDHYLDDGASYHLRPSAWVEPLDGWGRGAVQLVEIPTADETFDNIVVFWSPEELFQPGQERVFKYRLHWGEPPVSSRAAKVVATRIGAGGIPGQKNRIPSRKFVIDFEGGRLSDLPETAKVEPIITTSRGQIKEPAARPLRGTNAWRCNFDLISDGSEPVDLRCYLRDELGALTETWLYQWTPAA